MQTYALSKKMIFSIASNSLVSFFHRNFSYFMIFTYKCIFSPKSKVQTIIKCGNISISFYYLYQYDSTFWGYTGVFFGFNISVIGSPPKRRGEFSLQQMPKKDKKVLSALFNFQPSSLAFTSSNSCSTAPNALKVSAVVVVDGYSSNYFYVL